MTAPDRVSVRLLAFPLAVYGRSLEHSMELVRELSLIALGQQDEHSPTLPARLIALIDSLTRDYAGVTDAADARRDEALEAGLDTIDLTYRVPPTAAEACRTLRAVLDEVDQFCESGDDLLTLTTPPEARQFRDWYFDEFIAQIAGEDPTPWPDYAGANAR